MDLEIVISREFFSLIGDAGQELSDVCNSRVRYCVRKKGNTKPEKCFPTLQKAKDYITAINNALNAQPKI
jgi:molybdenum cofactor biosynthesis enzyme MoaA